MFEDLPACKYYRTKEFMMEYDKLCRKYNMAIVPTYENSVSFHDPMVVVEYDSATSIYTIANTKVERKEESNANL